MPRLGRNTVKFTVNDNVYVAVFAHRHCGRKLIEHKEKESDRIIKRLRVGQTAHRFFRMVEDPIIEQGEVNGRPTELKLRHITTVKLRRDGITVAEGVARCSMKEKEYLWHKGVTKALESALKQLGITRETDKALVQTFLRSMMDEYGIREPEAVS